MKYKIEKNVPIPEKKGRKKYPFGDMEIGDSFVMQKVITTANSIARSYGNRHKVRFTCYAISENKTRVWRTA
jgi:hypothetical protein